MAEMERSYRAIDRRSVAATKRLMAVMERTQSQGTVNMTQSERSYTARCGRSMAATERALTAMERTVEESAYN